MEVGCISECGNIRKVNQDNMLACKGRIAGKEFALCAVADGMGGTQDGSLASSRIIDALKIWQVRELERLLELNDTIYCISKSLDNLIKSSNRDIVYESALRGLTTGTTISVLFIYEGQAVIKHIGDSRIYVMRNEECCQLSKDHTWVQQLIDMGKSPYESREYFYYKNALTNALGADGELWIDTSYLQCMHNDIYLLCSDGFYNFFDVSSGMREIKGRKTLKHILKNWVGQVLEKEADDNLTAVLVYC